ncbi:MAG: hypothetical protein MK135_15285 [Polyangiaceae bacterium]|nr:hypothetical protein [Polyangiaceae bacterium]
MSEQASSDPALIAASRALETNHDASRHGTAVRFASVELRGTTRKRNRQTEKAALGYGLSLLAALVLVALLWNL